MVMKPALFFVVPVFAALAPIAGAVPGPETHLLRVSAPDRGIVLFLPSSEIDSEKAAASWIAWARLAHPERSGRMVFRWDADDPFEARTGSGDLVGLVREGDEAVDPAGNIAFRVWADPGEGTEKLQLVPAAVFEPGEATPGFCFTNAWVLSWDRLSSRWRKAAKEGSVSEVRREIAVLQESFNSSQRWNYGGLREWSEKLDSFRAELGALRPSLVFTNATASDVRLAVAGSTNVLASGDERKVPVPDGAKRIRWSVRMAEGGPEADADWRWHSDEEMVSGLVDDRKVTVSSVGSRLPRPQLIFPPDSIPDSAERSAKAVIVYEPDGEKTATIRKGADGRPFLEAEPGRGISCVRISASGWEDGEFAPPSPGGLPRGTKTVLKPRAPMLEVWPRLVVRIDRKGIENDDLSVSVDGYATFGTKTLKGGEREIRIDTERLLAEKSENRGRKDVSLSIWVSRTPDNKAGKTISFSRGGGERVVDIEGLEPPPTPPQSIARAGTGSLLDVGASGGKKHDQGSIFARTSGGATRSERRNVPEWKDRDWEIIRTWFRGKGTFSMEKGLLYYLAAKDNEPDAKGKKKKAEESIESILALWPSDDLSDEERFFASAVAHAAECSGLDCWCYGDLNRRDLDPGRRLDSKTLVLAALGWPEKDQKSFVEQRKDKWPWPWDNADPLTDYFPYFFGTLMKDASNDRAPNQKAAKTEVCSFWNGLNCKETAMGEEFKAAYRHVEALGPFGLLDKAVPDGVAKPLLAAGSPESRRRAFFKALMLQGGIDWGDSKPTPEEIDSVMDKLDEWTVRNTK